MTYQNDDSDHKASAADEKNLVKFPASRYFSERQKDLQDPLKDLLEEFVSEEELAELAELELAFDDEDEMEIGTATLGFLPGQAVQETPNLDPKQFAAMPADEMREYILDQLKVLDEARRRIGYLLYEIDTYLPKK